MLFSATMPGAVVSMARRYMKQPTHIRANDPDDGGQTVKNIEQVVYRAHALDKVEMLARILQAEGRGRTIVFARTKRTAAKVADELVDRGFAAGSIHGDLGQGAREQALRAFRNGKIDVLVATDVAARGIDVEDVTHVVNYQCPEDEKTYLHRTGRTGRAGQQGHRGDVRRLGRHPRWSLIDKALDLGIPEPVETYSSSPHLYTDLHIPEGTKGRLPKERRTLAGLEAEEIEDLGETGKRHTPAGGSRGRQGDRSDGGRGRSDGERGRSGGQGRSGGRRGETERTSARAEGERTEATEGAPATEGGERRRRSAAAAARAAAVRSSSRAAPPRRPPSPRSSRSRRFPSPTTNPGSRPRSPGRGDAARGSSRLVSARARHARRTTPRRPGRPPRRRGAGAERPRARDVVREPEAERTGRGEQVAGALRHAGELGRVRGVARPQRHERARG